MKRVPNIAAGIGDERDVGNCGPDDKITPP
jgi:hypothetical protein